MKKQQYFEVTIEKLVHGGQGIGTLTDGRKVFVWNALPGEKVLFLVTKKKRDLVEGIATEIVHASKNRIQPLEPEIFTATSPWQIITYEKEAEFKQAIVQETFEREKVEVAWDNFYQNDQEYGYRNKMEYNFWFDNETSKVSLALHKRGTHQKVAVEESALANKEINKAGRALIDYINENNIEARPLKSVIIRSTQQGKIGVSLFVNDKSIKAKFSNFKLANCLFEIIYSDPKSPASVSSEVLVASSDMLTDQILGKDFLYTTRSFFQVNVPVYETVIMQIAKTVQSSKFTNVIDLYSGVGSIGMSVINNKQKLTMIEVSEESTAQAEQNIKNRKNCKVVTATAESALQYFTGNEIVIVDPPRAGLHKDVTSKLIDANVPEIVYLSCNPSTQARDIKLLVDAGYQISYARAYNFFPRTPHIESLIILDRVK